MHVDICEMQLYLIKKNGELYILYGLGALSITLFSLLELERQRQSSSAIKMRFVP